ncbi:hypothetical protein [Maribacter cobaltidurans]|jgi:hypothetical protein|uniref:Uncharacterized protein n=1 Tax=Maribacter cobaltidurans TaxID=1178778 RepID=A0A223V3N5_9FLAO|nr:hypothetical protein [Maribacter cobaltidurans]ASV29942.1 hypothetical protein CJ263_06735 [Maribacter cobaltidurans]GGD88488.1 hypothetical protein GCM10011412_27980 [Maribacter cobaltidurans]
MEEEIRVDEDFKNSFNMGYRVAQELNLKTQILRDHEKLVPNNPIHLGMQQYIDEAKLAINIKKKESLNQSTDDTLKKKKGKSRGRGPSL